MEVHGLETVAGELFRKGPTERTKGNVGSDDAMTKVDRPEARGQLMENTANAVRDVPVFIRRRSLHIVFASTSGHTEYVVDALIDSLKSIAPGWEIDATMAEKTQPQDLLRGDVLVLASATWNTGSIEGQLNPHMWDLLRNKAKNLDFAGKPCACIGLGDHRYFYTARAADHLEHYVKTHHGRLILPTLKIINEPYGQEEVVRVWGKQLVDASKGWRALKRRSKCQ